MKLLFRNLYAINLLLAVMFFVAVLITAFQIYSLPYNAFLPEQENDALTDVYLWFTIVSLSGSMAIVLAILNKKEIIVYRNKPNEQLSVAEAPVETIHSAISLEFVKASLQTAENESEFLAAGLNSICKQLDACRGALYIMEGHDRKKSVLKAGYALTDNAEVIIAHEPGDGIVAQVAANGKPVYIDDLPEGYIKVTSGLGHASAKYLFILPFIKEEQILGVVEVASFSPLAPEQKKFAQEAVQLIADKLFETVGKIV